MDRSGFVDNSAAMPALARGEVGGVGRAMVVVCTHGCVYAYMYIHAQGRHDVVPRAHQHSMVREALAEGQVSAER